MENEWEQDLPLYPKSYPHAVLVGGSLDSFYTMDGAYTDHNMQIKGDKVFYNNIFAGCGILSKQE